MEIKTKATRRGGGGGVYIYISTAIAFYNKKKQKKYIYMYYDLIDRTRIITHAAAGFFGTAYALRHVRVSTKNV